MTDSQHKIIKFSLLLLQVAVSVHATCDVCQSGNNVACHNETAFSLCINGIPTHDVINCPDNSICTANAFVCYDRATAAAVSCARTDIAPPDNGNKCGICNEPSKVFSCINATTIAFCFGANHPDRQALAQCPPGTYCDLNNLSEFCTAMEPAEASCRQIGENQPTATTPTPVAPRTPDQICSDEQKSETFPYDNDTACAEYILCYEMTGKWMAIKKKCPTDQFYNKELKFCSTTKPEYCI